MPIPVCPDCGHPWSRHRESIGKPAEGASQKTLDGAPIPFKLHQDEICLECLYGPQAPSK